MFRRLGISVLFVVLMLAACAGGGEEEVSTRIPPAAPAETEVSPAAAEATAEPARPPETVTTMTRWELWSGGSTMLRGANIYQRRNYPELEGDYNGPGPVGPPYTQEDLNRLAELGANYVNISHPGLFSEEPPYELDEGVQANLDALLEKIEQADMFAVISFRTGPGRSEFTFFGLPGEEGWFDESYLNDSVWEDRDAQDAWVEMWRYTAERYRDNPIVVGYDLMVEPNSSAVFFEIYWPPDFYPAYAGTLYDWNQFYPRIVEAIREVDTATPILVGTLCWSQIDWLPYLEPTDDPYTVYTVHQYAPHHYTHQPPDDQGNLPNTYPGEFDLDWDGAPDTFDREWLEEWLRPIDEFRAGYGVPVAINEYGVYRYEPGAVQYMDDLMGLFEARGMNYALWAWTSAWVLAHGGVEEFEFRLGTDMDNRTLDVPNALMDVVLSYWEHNTLRPSNTAFAQE